MQGFYEVCEGVQEESQPLREDSQKKELSPCRRLHYSLYHFLLLRVVRQQLLVSAAPRASLDSPQPLEELLNKDATLWNLSRHDRYEFTASPTSGKRENNAGDIDVGAGGVTGGQRSEEAAINHPSPPSLCKRQPL